jgi:hypothetical protein
VSHWKKRALRESRVNAVLAAATVLVALTVLGVLTFATYIEAVS